MNFNALGRAVVPPPVLPRDRRVHSDELGHAGELTRGLLPHGTEGLAVVAPGGVEHHHRQLALSEHHRLEGRLAPGPELVDFARRLLVLLRGFFAGLPLLLLALLELLVLLRLLRLPHRLLLRMSLLRRLKLRQQLRRQLLLRVVQARLHQRADCAVALPGRGDHAAAEHVGLRVGEGGWVGREGAGAPLDRLVQVADREAARVLRQLRRGQEGQLVILRETLLDVGPARGVEVHDPRAPRLPAARFPAAQAELRNLLRVGKIILRKYGDA